MIYNLHDYECCIFLQFNISHPPNSGGETRRNISSVSVDSISLNSRDVRKRKEKDRAAERRRKLDAQSSDVEIGRIVDESEESESGHDSFDRVDDAAFIFSAANLKGGLPTSPGSFKEMRHSSTTLDRSSSDQSTGSVLYGKTPGTGVTANSLQGGGVSAMLGSSALGKSSSLIFPTGVDAVSADSRARTDSGSSKLKRSQVNLRLDQCEAIRFPFKKKLMLDNLNLTFSDVPVKDLCGTALGASLQKLSLDGNRLGVIPPRLVVSLPALKTLSLSQCELHQLPEIFNLPRLTRLNLSHNRLTEFPEEVSL